MPFIRHWNKPKRDMIQKTMQGALFGVAVGDALGVPVEFKSREYLRQNPVTEMLGYLCWKQPHGTWSDDSSLTFCLAESLTNGYDIIDIAQKFVQWYQTGYWGAHHKLFDIGGATRYALNRIIAGTSPYVSGGLLENDNGNGSLMRILPLVFYLDGKGVENMEEILEKVREVSGITHGHFRSIFSCFIYIVFALELLNGNDKELAYYNLKEKISQFLSVKAFNPDEISNFDRILKYDISDLKGDEIQSSGYVLHSLEASFWCLLTTNSYKQAVLKAVNLGGDTDTTGAITGGLAGILYGYDLIPKEWIDILARKNDIDNLCNRLARKYC